MKLSDFYIGLEFIEGPFWWRCTDIGTRTVTAIRLVEDDSIWYEGPPYMVQEEVLDDVRLVDCHLSEREHTQAALNDADRSQYPRIPHEAVVKMFQAKIGSASYPRENLFRFNRVRADGEILHPYAAAEGEDGWEIQLYLPFTKGWAAMSERAFIALRIASSKDVERRAA